jgi:hypothetical protein
MKTRGDIAHSTPRMRHVLHNLLIPILCAAVCLGADVAPMRLPTTTLREINPSSYYWQSTPVDGTAQLLTLFCKPPSDGTSEKNSEEDVPLVSVLRDTLGDADPENDRVTYVWLLSYTRPTLGRRALSAVPFFYWRVGDGSRSSNDTAPLLDLTTPQHPVLSEIGRDLLQWTALDPMMMPVRAGTRAYRTNSLDQERLHLEEAITYLRQAPVSDDQTALTRAELDTVIARLELRKRLLGGLVGEQAAARFGEESGFDQERIRSRNWEILRMCAERTGLVFEPIPLSGASDQYAILWFRLGANPPTPGVSLNPVWKVLNIKNPWADERVQERRGPAYARGFDENGTLVPPGTPSAQSAQLVPLAVYGLNYPKFPLLLIDFRDKLHTRRHEMTQRSINEITSGVIGISHFTNWYYYVGADLYDFVVSRHGAAMDRAARLDSYSQLRVELALDHGLDADLRGDLQRRLNVLALNPLDAAPYRDMQVAAARYSRLQGEAQGGGLTRLMERQRRAEVADFGESGKRRAAETLLHVTTFGLYNHLAKRQDTNLAALDRDRRIEYHLNFVDSLNRAGTPPEVAYDAARIRASVSELSRLVPQAPTRELRLRAAAAIQRLQTLSHDSGVQNDCTVAIAALNRSIPVHPASATGIVASSAAVVK